ncbi:hypothetical protein SAMN05443248_3926 [Bradyrhizobium erythrophlei]|uniref:Uncharacterized protein n=1 Tax=Bradyrhizobium erythrophlei TaxID=1437360 RepID=A0A1M5QS21_9BRAD|nr:hypothetical protein SAMN05443248_3926 [Bradyrhizobium erythrophlei]
MILRQWVRMDAKIRLLIEWSLVRIQPGEPKTDFPRLKLYDFWVSIDPVSATGRKNGSHPFPDWPFRVYVVPPIRQAGQRNAL